jgi:PLP dependent protein
MNDIAGKLSAVLQAIRSACAAAGRRPDAVRLVAVSKTFSAEDIRTAAAAGQRAFGESYLQEAMSKIAVLDEVRAGTLLGGPGEPLEWHFIGPLQSNKTRDVAAHFHWVHGVDRLRIAQRLAEQRPERLPPLQVCVQVNVSGEASKSGCTPAEAASLCASVAGMPRLRLRGLMTIPEAVESPEQARPAFRLLRGLHEEIRAAGKVDPAAFDTLSMGMSHDFRVAIEEGATMVRVGSAIFGRRETGGERA